MISVNIELEEETKTYEFPTSWDEVSVEQFMRVFTNTENKYDGILGSVKVISSISNISEEILMMMDINDFKMLADQLAFVSQEVPKSEVDYIEIDGSKFYLYSDFNKFTTGEIITIELLLEQAGGSIFPVITDLLCVFLRKKKEDGTFEYTADTTSFTDTQTTQQTEANIPIIPPIRTTRAVATAPEVFTAENTFVADKTVKAINLDKILQSLEGQKDIVNKVGKFVNDKNNLVRAKAVVILNENKIKIPNYVNKFMWSKSRDWKEDPIDETQIDWATGLNPDEIERQEQKKQKAKKALAQIKKINAPTKTEVKSDDEIYPLSRAEQIRSYVESLPQPSVEEIIRNRAAIRTRYSGIGSLNFKEPEFEIERPKSTGLNYLSGFSDEVENSERRKKEKEEENDR